ncbi:hypothetical protein DPMN_004829 [Dreissena polymorpha]|uniref:Uncharacterized protein n=1 Tax=Dreissena polymorpha TaxID=45954 RepID=A0A9D4RW88_DREPO|nr:hypothetical protein DPMN_004829 [Dreissena polymorpha]
MHQYSRTVSKIFRYSSNTALRSNRLWEIQSILNLPELKFAQVLSVRRLSMEAAVEAIYSSYPARIIFLEYEATQDAAARDHF